MSKNIKNFFKNILENTSFLLVVSLFLSVLFPYYSYFLEPYLIFLLIIMMVFSLKDIDIKIQDLKNKIYLKKMLFLFFINYFLLPFIIIFSAFFLLSNINFRNGFIIMASVPCAIVVITFTKLLKGDVLLSTLGLYLNYVLSIFMTPFIIWLFFKENISIIPLLKTIFLLVVLPLILAKILDKTDKKIFRNKLQKYDKIIINLIFVITTYAFIGINLTNINIIELKDVFLVLAIKTFFLSSLFFIFTKNISYVVFTNYKNLGYAIILSLTLFNIETALPSVIGIFFDNLLFLIISLIKGYSNNRISALHILK